MSIYKRKDSSFYWYDFTVCGQRRRGCTKETNKQRASIKESALIAQIRDQGVDAVLQKAPTLKEFSSEFLKWVDETHSIGHDTKRHYRNGWRMLELTALAGMRMNAITNHHCETISFAGSNYNANQALSTLRRMFGKAEEMGIIYRKSKIELRKVWGRSVAMTVAQAELIASCMVWGNPRDAFLVIRGTGMRPKECFAMRWEYLRRAERYYQNPQGKSRSARRPIPLLGSSMHILERRYTEQGQPEQGWVFPAKKSKCGHMMTIQKAFTKARKAAKLADSIVLYTARHGMGTDLAAVVSLKEVMETLGHADAKTALGYQHPDTMALQAKLEAAKTTGRIQ